MNRKLIFQLSLFGLIMGFGTISLIPDKVEPMFWLVIFSVCAYFIAKVCTERYFMHGFWLSMCNSVWITLAHVLFYKTYAVYHAGMVNMYEDTVLHNHPRIITLLLCPVSGAFFGLIQGMFAVVASKILKNTAAG